MYDLIVIGSGYWGTAIQREALSKGLNSIVVTDRQPHMASMNATGIVSLEAYKSKAISKLWSNLFTLADIKESIESLKLEGFLHSEPEFFSSWQNPVAKKRDTVYLMDDIPYLSSIGPTILGQAQGIVPSSGEWLVHMGAEILRSKAVAVAAGVWTDELLRRSGIAPIGVESIKGTYLQLTGWVGAEGLWTHMTRPYTAFHLRAWHGKHYLGATTERTEANKKAISELHSAFKAFGLSSLNMDRAIECFGLRPYVDSGIVCKEIRPGLVVATGGYKVGIGLAPLIANRTMKMLGIPE